MPQLNPYEIRFYGNTSAHGRIMHFKTWAKSLQDYMTTGNGSISLPAFRFSNKKLPGHTATLPDAANFTSVDKGNYSLTATPFSSTTAKWSLADPNNGGWRMDDVLPTDVNTIHQVWVRSVVTGNNYTLGVLGAGTSALVLRNANGTASMNNASLPLYDTLGNATRFQRVPFPTGMDFMMWNVSIADKLWVTPTGYLAFSPQSFMPPLITSGFSNTGPALLLGAHPRALRTVWMSPAFKIADLQFCVLGINTHAQPKPTSSKTNLLNYEITFAKDAAFQYIEVRAGADANYTSDPNNMGVWGLDDGNGVVQGLPNVTARSSVLLQSDLAGRTWKLFNWTLLMRAMPPPPSPPPACVESQHFAIACRCVAAPILFLCLVDQWLCYCWRTQRACACLGLPMPCSVIAAWLSPEYCQIRPQPMVHYQTALGRRTRHLNAT